MKGLFLDSKSLEELDRWMQSILNAVAKHVGAMSEQPSNILNCQSCALQELHSGPQLVLNAVAEEMWAMQ